MKNRDILPDLSNQVLLKYNINDILRIKCSNGSFDFFGLKMSQVPQAVLYLSELLNIVNPQKILEFGTEKGGLSVLFSIYSQIKGISFYTFDSQDYLSEYNYFLKNDFHKVNLLDNNIQNNIKDIIKKDGKNLLVCDALKSEEIKIYAPYLKPGDIVIMHDYSRIYNSQEWQRDCNYHGWTAPQEQWYGNIAETCKQNNILPFMHDDFEHVLWFCGIKQ